MDETAEFGFIFNVKGNAEKAFKRMSGYLKSITAESRASARSYRAPRDEFGRFVSQGTKGAVGFAGSIGQVSSALSDATGQITALTSAASNFFGGFVRQGVQTAAAIEESNARLAFGLSKMGMPFDEINDRIDEVSLKTVLTRADLQDMVSELAIQRINAFDTALDSLQYTATDGSKKTISAVESIADAVAFSGKNVNRVMFSIKETVSEGKIRPGRFLSDDLNLARDEVKKWNKELDKAKSNQERFNTLMGLITDRVGGTTGALGDTLNFTLQQIDDWVDKISSEAFKGVLPVIRDLVREIGEWFLTVTKEGYMDKVREAFTDLAKQAAAVARFMFNVATAVFEFVRMNPWVIKLVSYLIAAGVALGTIVGAIASVAAVVLAFQALWAALPAVIAAVQAAVVALFTTVLPYTLLLGLVVGGLVVGFMALAKVMLGGKDWADTWERVKLVLSAIWEGIKGMTGDSATLSKETAMALQKAGLLDFVWNFLRVLNRVKKMAITVYQTFMGYWPAIQEAGVRIWGSISRAVESFARIFGINTKGMQKGADTTMDSWVETGIAIGEVFAHIILFIVMLVEWIAKAIEGMANLYEKATQVGEGIADWAADWTGVGVQEEERTSVRGAPGFMGQGAMAAGAPARGAPGFLGQGAAASIVTPREALQQKNQKEAADALASMSELQRRRLVELQDEKRAALAGGDRKSAAVIDDKVMKEFGKTIANAVAKAPLKVNIDGKNVTDLIAEQSQQNREAGA